MGGMLYTPSFFGTLANTDRIGVEMLRSRVPLTLLASLFLSIPDFSMASEGSASHSPHNHIAFILGTATENHDSHRQSGGLLGLEYERQYSETWGVGAVFEQEAFGDRTNRHAIVAIPVSYHPNEHWRLFMAPGLEFHSPGDPGKALLRIGSGYEFKIGGHFTVAPEFQIDFVAGGAKVYVFAVAFGYGF